MFLAKVEGTLVATKTDPSMNGRKLLLLRPQLVDEKDPTKFRPGQNTIVAVDVVGCGEGEMVLFSQGSSARLAGGMKDTPVDAVVIGIVDSVDVFGKQIFSARLEPRMNTNGHKCRKQIVVEGRSPSPSEVSSTIEVLNEIGHGLHEKPYENALVEEFNPEDSNQTASQLWRSL